MKVGCPSGRGAIATDFSGGMVRDHPEMNKRVSEMTALGRAGVPDDIGPMIASLVSEDDRWINAQRIEVSGGMALWNDDRPDSQPALPNTKGGVDGDLL